MTDKLYFDATAREKLQPNTFMQSTLLKKLSAFICFCAVLCGSGRHVSAQISVGTTGTGTNAFGSQPTVAQGWSTLTVGAAGGTYTTAAGLDAAIIGSANRSTITTPLGASGTLPPSANAIARWNSDAANGLYLQTRPTGNDYLLLMATLRNNTGLNLAQVNISYLWGQKHPIPVVEEIPGHRAYFSLSGAPGSWALIPSLSSFSTTDAALNLNALLSVGTWTNGGNLYIIWADDNGSAGTETNAMREGSYTIDNFAVTPVSTAPNIFIQPQSQSVVPGGTVTFSVGASGFPLSFYWRRNGTFIPGATNQNLTITNAQIANEGSYSVIVSNALGNVTSANATLAAYCSTPISVVNQPSDQQIATGGSFALSVVASGTAPFTYQWYRNNSPIPNATNSSYSKVNAQSPDSGLYAVLINNCVAPLFSTNAVISVAPPPTVLIPLTNFVWRYNQSGTDFGTAWRASIYPAENTWPTGRGLFALE
ncbi:MAG TPA: immunoglobulin domain-containing protein, partial [Candidatus Limnocylindria bacterium]|nr:immunoglobulin domain-containing protein [Candidatus Limnocylindria bacterium]